MQQKPRLRAWDTGRSCQPPINRTHPAPVTRSAWGQLSKDNPPLQPHTETSVATDLFMTVLQELAHVCVSLLQPLSPQYLKGSVIISTRCNAGKYNMWNELSQARCQWRWKEPHCSIYDDFLKNWQKGKCFDRNKLLASFITPSSFSKFIYINKHLTLSSKTISTLYLL